MLVGASRPFVLHSFQSFNERFVTGAGDMVASPPLPIELKMISFVCSSLVLVLVLRVRLCFTPSRVTRKSLWGAGEMAAPPPLSIGLKMISFVCASLVLVGASSPFVLHALQSYKEEFVRGWRNGSTTTTTNWVESGFICLCFKFDHMCFTPFRVSRNFWEGLRICQPSQHHWLSKKRFNYFKLC